MDISMRSRELRERLEIKFEKKLKIENELELAQKLDGASIQYPIS